MISTEITEILQIFSKMLTTRIENLARIATTLNADEKLALETEILKISTIASVCNLVDLAKLSARFHQNLTIH